MKVMGIRKWQKNFPLFNIQFSMGKSCGSICVCPYMHTYICTRTHTEYIYNWKYFYNALGESSGGYYYPSFKEERTLSLERLRHLPKATE